MKGFTKISNRIFSYKLTPKSVFVYSYLSSKINRLRYATVKLETIALACNMDTKTVRSAIKELSIKKLINKENRYNCRGYITSRYYVLELSKRFIKLDNEIFKTGIKSTDFMVYLYIISKMSENDMQSFPSLSNIQSSTGVSRGRISKSTAFLMTFTYINKVRRKYKKTLAYRHNRYLKFKIINKIKINFSQVISNIINTNHMIKNKNIFIFGGSTHFP